MVDEEELSRIVEEESSETFESFTDIDSISDTTVLAITFLLSAQVTLSTVVVTSSLLASTVLRNVFIGMGFLTMVLVFLSLNSIVKSLLPVGFYSRNVGETLLEYSWIPIGNSKPAQFGFLEERSSDDTSDRGRLSIALNNLRRSVRRLFERSDAQRPAPEQRSVRGAAERFVDEYSAATEVDDYDTYQLAKLQHFKEVGQRKAQYTGIGLAWLRLSVVAFVLQFTVLFAGVVVT